MKFNKQSGLASQTIIVLVVVLLIVGIGAYAITKFATSKKASSVAPVTSLVEIPKPVYETQIGDIKFVLQSVKNMGNILTSKSSSNPGYQSNLVTTEKFIKVTVSAQNKGKNNTTQSAWDLGKIIDSEARNFLPITYRADSWLPQPDLCGTLLKPEFEPTTCVRYYEVSKVSQGLKLEVMVQSEDSSKMQKKLIDLYITK